MKQNKSQALSPKQSEIMQVAVALHQSGQMRMKGVESIVIKLAA